jgi:very-short-patch-repair endonuclease
MACIKTSYRNDFYFGASRELITRAKKLRKVETNAERILWDALRNKRFSHLKFRRQHPVKWFIADFYCHEIKLIIEVDGGIHNQEDKAAYDTGRMHEIESLGLIVIRFSNDEILNNLTSVLNQIQRTIQSESSPSQGGEGAGG